MSFESPGHRERQHDDEFDRTENLRALDATWKERIERTARLAALTAAIVAPVGFAHAGEIDLTDAAQQSEISRTLNETPSTGSITLASGETIPIPTTAQHFNKVTVYTPREGDVWRVVVFVQGNHMHTSEQMRGLSDEAKRAWLDALERSQKIIYDELDTLGKRGVITSVCQEGIIASPDNKNANDLINSLSSPARFDAITTRFIAPYLPAAQEASAAFFDKYNRPGEISAAGAAEIKAHFAPIFHSFGQAYPHVLGAAEIFAAKSNGAIKLCGAEEQATLDASSTPDIVGILARSPKTWKPEETKLIREKVVDDREDAALRQVLAQDGPAVALEMGGAHRLAAAAARWNFKHPTEQIALVQADAVQADTVAVASKSSP